MPAVLTIWSALHGDRYFEKIGAEPHQTKDGRTITLGTWCGSCVICGGPYTVTAPLDPLAILINRSGSFAAKRPV